MAGCLSWSVSDIRGRPHEFRLLKNMTHHGIDHFTLCIFRTLFTVEILELLTTRCFRTLTKNKIVFLGEISRFFFEFDQKMIIIYGSRMTGGGDLGSAFLWQIG
jgi:hypothetical protein